MIPLKKPPPYFLRDSVAAQNGRGVSNSNGFLSVHFRLFAGLPDSTQVPLMLEQLRRSGLLQAVRESSPVCFFGVRQMVHLGSHENGEFFEFDFLTPKFQKVISMAVPNGVIGRCSSLQNTFLVGII